MKVVELFGAPGVGKTTLLAKLRTRRPRNANWVTEAHVLARLRPETGHGGTLVKWLANWLAGRPQGHLMVSARDAFVSEYPHFARLCWSMLHEHRAHESYPVDSRFGAATHYWNCFGRVASLRTVEDPRLVVMDEGLLQRLTSLWSPAVTDQEVDSYLSTMPAPAAAILVVADEEVAIKRIRSRRRQSGNHLGMNDQQVREFTRNTVAFSESIGDALARRGVRMCRIDATASLEANVTAMVEFLDALR